jgi:glycoside/pentoside/hexuronide:cation symporter, GPH family
MKGEFLAHANVLRVWSGGTMQSENASARLSWGKRIAYVAGNIGTAATMQFVSTFVLVLYLPNDERPSLIPGLVAGVGTYFLLSLLARGIDSFFDAWVAHRSDRSTSRLGRRRSFMLAGALPVGLSTALIFCPPDAAPSALNVAWLGFWLTAYFCAFSVWGAPYLALLPELAPDRRENALLATLQAVCALLGGVLASVVAPSLLQTAGERHALSLQQIALGVSAISIVLLLLPPLAIHDRHFAHGPEPAASLQLVAALRHTIRDRAFRHVLIGSNLFFFAFTMVQTALPFMVVALLERPLHEQGHVIGPLFIVSFLSFPLVLPLSHNLGNRRLMIAAALVFALLIAVGIPMLSPGADPQALNPMAILLFGAVGVPIAIFLAISNAMMADVCTANVRRTGQRGEAMFFGASGFVQKVTVGAAAGLVSWLMEVYGKTSEHPLGIQLCGPVAALALLGAAAAFWRYPEAHVHAEMTGSAAATPLEPTA